jgi:hypothetical protein
MGDGVAHPEPDRLMSCVVARGSTRVGAVGVSAVGGREHEAREHQQARDQPHEPGHMNVSHPEDLSNHVETLGVDALAGYA